MRPEGITDDNSVENSEECFNDTPHEKIIESTKKMAHVLPLRWHTPLLLAAVALALSLGMFGLLLPRSVEAGAPPGLVLTVGVGPRSVACPTATSYNALQGELVRWCYSITNNTATTYNFHRLQSVYGIIIDPGDSNQPFALAPGQTRKITDTVPAEPVDDIVNNAFWESWVTSPPGTPATAQAAATLHVTAATVSVLLTKTVGTTPGCASTHNITVVAGSNVYYCYKIKNTGTVPLATHSLHDSKLGTIFAQQALTISPGSIYTDLRGPYAIAITTTNIATWTAYRYVDPDVHVSSSDSALVRVQVATATPKTPTPTPTATQPAPPLPAITLAKTVGENPHACATGNNPQILVGQPAIYCYRITNTGNTPLTRHTIVDDKLDINFDNVSRPLAIGASFFVTVETTALVTTTNVATATSWVNNSPTPYASDSASATVRVPDNSAEVELRKSVGIEPGVCASLSLIYVPPETTVYYCYSVTNTGSTTLKRHQLYDDDFDQELLPDNNGEGFVYDFVPGETLTTVDLGVDVSRIVTENHTNLAIWESYINDTLYAQSDALATVRVLNPQSTLEVRVGAGDGCAGTGSYVGDAGDSYAWCVTLKNTGEITLTQHTLTMPAIGVTISRTVTLAPGASATWTRFEAPGLGPFILNDDLNVTAYLTSTFTHTGVPFVANASTTAGVFLLDEGDSQSWLPMIRRE